MQKMRFIVILFLISVFIGLECRPSLDQDAYDDDEEAEDSAEEAPAGTPMLGVVFEDESPAGGEQRARPAADDRAPRSSQYNKVKGDEQPQGKLDTRTADVLYDNNDAPAGGNSNKNTGLSDQRFPSDDDIRFSNAEVIKNKRTRNRQDDVYIDKRTVGNKRVEFTDEASYERRPEYRQRGNAEQVEDAQSNFNNNNRRYLATDPEAEHNRNVFDMYRGRRDAQTPAKDGAVSAENSTITEDEEAVIKRHIKKLSKEELEELFQSLSDDKKCLLKKIMESSVQDLDNLEKREITKKEGAVGLIDSFPIGNNKFMNGINSFFTASTSDTNSDKTEKDTASDSVTASPNNDQANQIAPELDRVSARIAVMSAESDQTTAKVENKRDVRSNYPHPDEPQSYFNEDEEGFNDQEEDINIESNAKDDSVNMQKRDIANSQDLAGDTVGSLQDSFPNFNNCDELDNPIASNMQPLVRVKRTEPDIPMNNVLHNPSSQYKVAYCPFKAEISEGNSESDEFENEVAENSNVELSKTELKDQAQKPLENTAQNEPTGTDTQRSNEAASQNESKLGSDSDAVLSGVEEVDENLMYGNIEQDIPSDNDDQNPKNDRIRRSAGDGQMLEESVASEKNEHPRSDPSYQENDAFGALPKNYEGELARYKRIRRVKEHPNKETHQK